jgi:hypothetical protein
MTALAIDHERVKEEVQKQKNVSITSTVYCMFQERYFSFLEHTILDTLSYTKFSNVPDVIQTHS